MPPGQKMQKCNHVASLKRNNRKITSSSGSTSASSHATVSEESCDVDSSSMNRSQVTSRNVSVGTVVKKYFNGRGWKPGKVVNIFQNGLYEVQYENEDGGNSQSHTYPLSKLSRLTKTASVHTGTKLAIYWPKEKRYYTAVITKELPRKRENYLICYCHNTVEREWIDLHRHRFRVVVPSSPCSEFLVPDFENSSNVISDGLASFRAVQQFSQPPQEVNCIDFCDSSSNERNANISNNDQLIVSLSRMQDIVQDIVREVSLGTRACSDDASRGTFEYPESCVSCERSEMQQPQHEQPPIQSFKTKNTTIQAPFKTQACSTASSMGAADYQQLGTSCDQSWTRQREHKSSPDQTPNLTIENETCSDGIGQCDGTACVREPLISVGLDETPRLQPDGTPEMRISQKLVVPQIPEKQSDLVVIHHPINYTAPDEASIANNLLPRVDNALGGTMLTEKVPVAIIEHEASMSAVQSCNKMNDPENVSQLLSDCESSQNKSDDSSYQQCITNSQMDEITTREEDHETFEFVSNCQQQQFKNLETDYSMYKICSNDISNVIDQLRSSTEIEIDNRCKRTYEVPTWKDDSLSDQISLINVGTRVEVYWPEDECYYAGVVKKRRTSKITNTDKRPFFLVYDDGESEWIDFRNHKFRLPDALNSVEVETSNSISEDIIFESKSHGDVHSIKVDEGDSIESKKVKQEYLEDVVSEKGVISSNDAIEIPSAYENVNFQDNLKTDLNTSSSVVHDCDMGERLQDVVPSVQYETQESASLVSSNVKITESSPQSPRRTSRNIHPPNFFAMELDHIHSHHSDENDMTTEKISRNISSCDGSTSEKSKTKSNDQSKSESVRHGRKAALEALVQKRFKKRHETGAEELFGVPDPSSERNLPIVKTPIESDDLSKLQVGVRVSIWHPEHDAYREGNIINNKGKKTFFLVDFSEGESPEWVDFENKSFQIIKRKRGRPKKVQTIDDADDVIDNNIQQNEDCSKMQKNEAGSDMQKNEAGTKIQKNEADSKMHDSANDADKILVGSKVAIFCKFDGKFHLATVAREKFNGKAFFVDYDSDRESEWIDFRVRQFELIDTTIKSNKRGRPPSKESSMYDDVTKVRIGSKVALWWEGDAKYIGGTITKIRTHNRPFYVVYDDGEAAHWVDLKKYNFKFLDEENIHEDKRRKTENLGTNVELENVERKQPKNASIGKTKEIFNDTTLSKIKVGSRLDIWWAGDSAYYAAAVRKIGTEMGRVFIRYDDDEEEWIDLTKNSFRLTSVGTGKSKSKLPAQKSRDYDDSGSESTCSSTDGKINGVYPDVDNDFVYGDVDKVKVGSRIAVWWTMDKVYYAGKVAKIVEGRKPFFIKYDDNDEEWTDLRKRYFRFLDKK